MKCKSCEQERYCLNREGICILCMNGREKADKENSTDNRTWVKTIYRRQRGVEVRQSYKSRH